MAILETKMAHYGRETSNCKEGMDIFERGERKRKKKKKEREGW